jgi:hypothetical protein
MKKSPPKPSAKQTKKTTAVKPAAKRTATKRATPKRATQPKHKAVTLKHWPALWQVSSGVQTVGLWVDDQFVWTGNDRGEIHCLDRSSGKVKRAVKLPQECVALVSDEPWKYAGCGDGNVYDLTGDVPRVAYQLGGSRIDWLEIYQGVLAVSDDKDTVTVIEVDGEIRWQKRDPATSEGWVLRTTGEALYHGSKAGLRRYSWDGKRQWAVNPGDVRYGSIDGDKILCTAGYFELPGGTVTKLIQCKDGKTLWTSVPDEALPGFYSTGAEACGVGKTPSGQSRYYSSIGCWLFCYNAKGDLLWQSPTNCDALCNLHVLDQRLFYSSAKGHVGCVDVSDEALARVQKGDWTQPKRGTVRRVAVARKSTELESVTKVGSGVLLECIKQGSKLRVRVVSDGYRSDWFCQFPSDIRVAGRKYVADQVLEAKQGGFYRVLGNIREYKKK